MANDISSAVWKIDTASASPVYAFRVKVTNVVWANETVGATLVITDANGKLILSAIATSGLGQNRFGGYGWQNGIIVSTLSAGIVSIAIGAGK